jgi:hypothetical protein
MLLELMLGMRKSVQLVMIKLVLLLVQLLLGKAPSTYSNAARSAYSNDPRNSATSTAYGNDVGTDPGAKNDDVDSTDASYLNLCLFE